MKISNVLEEFIKNQYSLGNTVATIRHYRTHIGFFINYYGDKEINTITYKVYQDYILYLRTKYKESSGFIGKNEKLSSRTIKTYASDLKTFLSYSYENGFIDENISSRIKLPRYKKKVIEILNFEQISDIINSFDKNSFIGIRDLLVTSLMLDCGLRLSEVISIKISDINITTKLIKINGKGQKERLVPLTPFVEECLKKYKYSYFLNFERVLLKEDFLIKSATGTNATKNTISLLFRRLRKKIGINVHPHLLRHTFATMYLLNGGDIATLQIILGHTTLNMVLNYLHLANQMSLYSNIKYTPLNLYNKKEEVVSN